MIFRKRWTVVLVNHRTGQPVRARQDFIFKINAERLREKMEARRVVMNSPFMVGYTYELLPLGR